LLERLSSQFLSISSQQVELKALSDDIAKKEEQARVSKKQKVYDTLEYFLNRFFVGKYSIDKDTFQIIFQNMSHENVSTILSDGEKSIVAFCFYLASTHLLLSRDSDYNRLFFIIDDPISSMDFHFVYAVAQVLREIKDYFGLQHARMYVFTHNLEFYSIITRNHTITQAYVMRPGSVEKLRKQLLMPYESHLHDVFNVANGKEPPSHTIGNSIRHVVETVCRFEYPSKNLEAYITENEVLSENSCIFTLCQDLSHGALRVQPPFDEQVLTEACKAVVAFMNEKYKGQVDALTT
jgi:wobble nucleotide-excising tRNase